jgi:hypothetical protein
MQYWKIKTIYQFDMSIYTKIFLKFNYTFWPTTPGSTFFLYADGKRGYYPFWQVVDHAAFFHALKLAGGRSIKSIF